MRGCILRLRRRHQKTLEAAKYKRIRASISLQYGNTIEVRLRLPALVSPALRAVAAEHFDADGLLRRERYLQFGEVLETLRNADGHAVIYPNCAENPVLQGGDAERGEGSSPQLGVCCCSMYWRMLEMGAPPQLPAK